MELIENVMWTNLLITVVLTFILLMFGRNYLSWNVITTIIPMIIFAAILAATCAGTLIWI